MNPVFCAWHDEEAPEGIPVGQTGLHICTPCVGTGILAFTNHTRALHALYPKHPCANCGTTDGMGYPALGENHKMSICLDCLQAGLNIIEKNERTESEKRAKAQQPADRGRKGPPRPGLDGGTEIVQGSLF